MNFNLNFDLMNIVICHDVTYLECDWQKIVKRHMRGVIIGQNFWNRHLIINFFVNEKKLMCGTKSESGQAFYTCDLRVSRMRETRAWCVKTDTLYLNCWLIDYFKTSVYSWKYFRWGKISNQFPKKTKMFVNLETEIIGLD